MGNDKVTSNTRYFWLHEIIFDLGLQYHCYTRTSVLSNCFFFCVTGYGKLMFLSIWIRINPCVAAWTATKQHAIVNIQLNIVACPPNPDKFIRDNSVAPSVRLYVVIVTLPLVAAGGDVVRAENESRCRAGRTRQPAGDMSAVSCRKD